MTMLVPCTARQFAHANKMLTAVPRILGAKKVERRGDRQAEGERDGQSCSVNSLKKKIEKQNEDVATSLLVSRAFCVP